MREAPDPAPVNSTATFVSGGVDSFWSLVKQQQARAVAGRPLTTDRTLPCRHGAEVTRAEQVIVRWNEALGMRYLRAHLFSLYCSYNFRR